MEKYAGKFSFNGKEYQCSVVNGVRYVEGKTVDEFFRTLTDKEKIQFYKVGVMALKDEQLGIKPKSKKYEYFLNE